MDQDTEAIREAMKQKIQEGVDRIMSRSYGNLDEMEEAVGRLKVEIGRETLERLIALKKTKNGKS